MTKELEYLKETCGSSNKCEHCPNECYCWDDEDCLLDTVYNEVTELAPEEIKGNYRNILEAIRLGKNIFLTAPGGCGKSFLLNSLKKHIPNLTVTASTGIAALNVGGATLHSTLGIGLANKPVSTAASNLKKYMVQQIQSLDFLAIDEVSMISGSLLNYCDQFLRLVRLNNEPFGGIQVILIGDFCQLPPVKQYNQEFYDYCFLSEAWRNLNLETFVLTHNFRQESDPEYADILSKLRVGQVTQEGWDLLQSRKLQPPESAPRLFPVNEQVNAYNAEKLASLGKAVYTNKAEYTVFSDFINKNPEMRYKIIENMKKNSIMVDELSLCEGARVMITRNLSKTIVNGSLGYVKDFIFTNSGDIKHVIVELDDDESIALEPVEQEMIGGDGKKLASMKQFPVKLAYSSTIHKCVHEDTLVEVKNKGLIPIKEVSIDDFINDGYGNYQRILDKSPRLEKEAIKITTRSGNSIICGLEHPLLISDTQGIAFVRGEDIKTGDYACCPRVHPRNQGIPLVIPEKLAREKHNLKFSEIPNSDIAWLLGYMVGNGCYSDAKNEGRLEIAYNGEDLEIKEKLCSILGNLGLPYSIRKKKNSNAETLLFFSTQFKKYLKVNGFTITTARFKNIPKCAFTFSSEDKGYFIRGMFDSDGSMSNNKARYASKSLKLIKSLKLLLSTLGIISLIKPLKSTESYQLSVIQTSLPLFYEKVNFYHAKKKRILNEAIARHRGKTNIDYIPSAKSLLVPTWYQIPRGKFQYNSNVGISYKNLNTLVEKCTEVGVKNKLKELKNLNFYYDEIAKIEPLPTKECMYDIEVEHTHTFFAQGFLAHNSQGQSLSQAYIDFEKFFEINQAYVALSRVRESKGLYLKNLSLEAIKFSPQVLEFYQNMN